MQTYSGGGRGQREYSWRKYLMVGIYALYHGKHGSKIGDLGRRIVLEKNETGCDMEPPGQDQYASVGT